LFQGPDRSWVLGLSINLLGYCPVFLPGIFILKYVKSTGYLERGPNKCLTPIIRLCFYGSEETIDDAIAKDEEEVAASSKLNSSSNTKQSDWKTFVNLIVCFLGLQVLTLITLFTKKNPDLK